MAVTYLVDSQLVNYTSMTIYCLQLFWISIYHKPMTDGKEEALCCV